MVIRTNISAINARRNLKPLGAGQSEAARRLSSGFRINSAADDAAGLAISENMRAQIRGLDQAYRNAQDGIALIRTAEGGIASINEMLIRMRELVVQAANDTYVHKVIYYEDGTYRVHSNRKKIQPEIDRLVQEIDALSQRVQFNNRTLLSGNYARHINQNAIILPTSQQLANEVTALLAPAAQAETVSPFNTPPVPTEIINAANFANGVSDPPDMWEVNSAGVLVIGNIGFAGHVIKIDGTGLAALGLTSIRVDDGATADIILYNVDINTDSGAAFDMREATVNLWLAEGSNNSMMTSGDGRAAIETTGGTIRINGTGSLTAQSSNDGAGIGGGRGEDGGTIIIDGGNIVVRGMPYGSGGANYTGAGIGGGRRGNGGNITINGGNITATAVGGAGIGGGGDNVVGGNGGNITINGGTVTAASFAGAGIGGGVSEGEGGVIHITGGIVSAESVMGAAVGGGGIGSFSGAGANLTVSGGLLEIIQGRIGGGGGPATIIPNQGNTIYTNGNISFGGNAPNIPGGVFCPAGNPLSVFQITFDGVTLEPFESVTFILYVNGDYRTFNAITDSLGQIFVWLADPPTDPPILVPPNGGGDNGNGNNNIPRPVLPHKIPGTGLWLQTGANAGQGLTLYIEAVDVLTLGLLDIAGSPVINVMMENGYDISPLLTVLDAALTHTNTVRANLGAVQNRLEFTSESLLVSSENLTEAESRLRNADMAREMMFLAGINVLQQAAISMLAQANQLNNSILQLLQDV